MDKDKLYETVNSILAKGNNVEIRKKPDGHIAVYEVKKKIAAE